MRAHLTLLANDTEDEQLEQEGKQTNKNLSAHKHLIGDEQERPYLNNNNNKRKNDI